jgi:hypothetical protein
MSIFPLQLLTSQYQPKNSAMKLSGIHKQAAIEAAAFIDTKKFTSQQINSDYLVNIGDKNYPFKLLVEKTYLIANKHPLPKDTFKEYNYLIKQFEDFTGFRVHFPDTKLFERYTKTGLAIINGKELLLKSPGADRLNLAPLGPDVMDEETKERLWEDHTGLDELRRDTIIFLTDGNALYALIQLNEPGAYNKTSLNISILHEFSTPIIHDFEFEDFEYPIGELYPGWPECQKIVKCIASQNPEGLHAILQRLLDFRAGLRGSRQ